MTQTYRNPYPPPRQIVEVSEDSYLWNKACAHFYCSWEDDEKPAPEIVRVLNVGNLIDDSIRKQDKGDFYRYRAYLERLSENFSQNWIWTGNEKRLFHGTKRTCGLGDPRDYPNYANGKGEMTNLNCCPRPDCSLCNIIQHSFDVDYAKRSNRFGPGIYVSKSSSKAAQDAYLGRNTIASGKKQGEVGRESPYRCVLLCRVLLGRAWYIHEEEYGELQEPPRGFHSIVARPYTGTPRCRYPDHEAVVYNNSAIRPWLLIVYEPRPM